MMHGIFFIIAIVRKFKNCISRLAKCWFDANGIKRLGGLHKSFPYRKALEDLRDIRRHLRVQRPPESEIDVGMSNVIDGGRDWIDREGEEDCDCGGIDLTPVQRRRAKEREKRIEARLKRKFSRQDKKKKSHPHCNLGIYLSPTISIPLCLSVSVSLYVCLFHAFSWYTYKPFSFFCHLISKPFSLFSLNQKIWTVSPMTITTGKLHLIGRMAHSASVPMPTTTHTGVFALSIPLTTLSTASSSQHSWAITTCLQVSVTL